MAFASDTDVEARLGRALSESETGTAGFLLEGAQAIIEAAADKAEADIDPIPPVLRFVAVELVVRAMANPESLASQSEALGAYSHTERFRSEANSDLLLTKLEEQMVRRAVHGQLSGTGQMKSLASDICVLCGLAPTICGGEWLGDEWLCGCEGS